MSNFQQIGVQQKLLGILPSFAARSLHMLQLAFVVLFCATLLACANGSTNQREVAFHSFGFNVDKDSPNVELLDYRYGSSRDVGVANQESQRKLGTSTQRASMSGPMHRGDDLYVKWRIKDTGKTYEDTVDLKSRLPRSIDKQRIYFIIDQEQLYVYLISFDAVREEAYTTDEAERIYGEMYTPHQRAFRGLLRNSVLMIYPQSKKLYPLNSK